MQHADQVQAQVVARLKKRHITYDADAHYTVRYASQLPSERRTLCWQELLDELTLHAIRYGVETIDEQTYIDVVASAKQVS